MVWYNDRPGNDDIPQRVDGDGKLLGGPFIALRPVRALSDAIRPLPTAAGSSAWSSHEHDDGTYAHLRTHHRRRRPGAGCRVPAQQRRRAQELFHAGDWLCLHSGHVPDRLAARKRGFDRPSAISRRSLPTAMVRCRAPTSSFSRVEPPSATAPALAYNRARNEFRWSGSGTTKAPHFTDIYGRLVTGNGQPLQPTSIEYVRMTVSNTKPAVAAAHGVAHRAISHHLGIAPICGGRPRHLRAHGGGDSTPDPGFYLGSANVDESRPAVAGSEDSRSTSPCGSDRMWRRWPSSTSITGASSRPARLSAGMPGCWAASPRARRWRTGRRRHLRCRRGQTAPGGAGHLRPTLGRPDPPARHPQAVRRGCRVDRARMARIERIYTDEFKSALIRASILPLFRSAAALLRTIEVLYLCLQLLGRSFGRQGRPARSAQ